MCRSATNVGPAIIQSTNAFTRGGRHMRSVVHPIPPTVKDLYGTDEWPINVPLSKFLTSGLGLLPLLPPPRHKATRRRLRYICLCVQRTLGHVLPTAIQACVVRYAVGHPRHWGGKWEADHRGDPYPINRYRVLQGIPDDSAEESDESYLETETIKHDKLINEILGQMQWGPRPTLTPTSITVAPRREATYTPASAVAGSTTDTNDAFKQRQVHNNRVVTKNVFTGGRTANRGDRQ